MPVLNGLIEGFSKKYRVTRLIYVERFVSQFITRVPNFAEAPRSRDGPA